MQRRGKFQRSTGCRITGALLLLALGCGQDPATSLPADDRAASAEGEEIAEKMLAAYRGAKSYTDHATYVQHSVYRGEGVERELPFFHMSIAFERPNRLRLSFEEAIEGSVGRKGFDIASNGVLMRCTAGELAGQVQESAAPPEISTENFLPDPLVREVFNNRSLGDVFPQLAMLLNEDDKTLVFPEDESPRLLDKKTLRDRDCFRVASTSPKGERILWIDCETYALLRMELPIQSERSTLDAEDQYSQLAVWIDFEDATFDADVDAKAFELKVAQDARRVRRFVAPPPPAPPEELGKALADFEFRSVDDAKITLDSLAGKAALLDFWQVDCAPCKAHTPDLDAIYQQLKDDDKFVFYAVNLDGARVEASAAEKTIRGWGGAMPVLVDPEHDAFKKLKVEGTPTLMLLDAEGRLQYLHIRQHNDPEGLVGLIRKVMGGADLAAEARAEHRQLTKDFEAELESVTIKDSVLEIEVARPEVSERKLPAKLAASKLWETTSDTIARPGNILVVRDGGGDDAAARILAMDGGQAIVEFDEQGEEIARHDLPLDAAKGEPVSASGPAANGLLRTTLDGAGRRWIAVSGVAWQRVHLFDPQWKHTLAFPKERHPGIADVQLLNHGDKGEPRLAVGYWGGVGVQGVGLDGKRKWSERSLDQVIQVALVQSDAPAQSELWCTSHRGTILVLNADGKPQREIRVGRRALMHVAVAQVDGGAQCCGLAIESVGRYSVVGFSAEGAPRWHYKLPAGEYAHQVERIQHVTLPAGQGVWMIAAANGSILWIDHEGQLIDEFRYGEPLTGLSLTNSADAAILLVSTAEALTAWKLSPNP
jgi:outer membrane lipoprotein-sorting protein/cytochrome oxidase Cu insertion factor (SCO1/SenC/PrrC family)